MASQNAIRDENNTTAALACLNTDTVQGTNLVRIKINTSNDGMMVNSTDVASFTMVPIDEKDQNYINCMTWEGTDGLLYPWVADANGAVLISG